uniref:Uncharacterized protein n=1 Tax=Pseudo-nitzschia australis TaxID=44445 RepID=A0A6U9ZPS9_9STRA|mmetsp:Transcript_23475/g.51387  ORF Transcript_23475/g.51387 Transcript_23475/m.51387 type:complete len:370 (+) Transcript_23475:109-1218(+)|eukprot:CAMPEP_0168173038 /NCGR_PEP_ID=MMETSP0139_2-20121125/5632_1 /TAXON_ID=44445 /ORGANISM="Pseudo-nitzschia australis, Strain 10249 10 AB" /LENGTH=369 /DNA_ID=CAMNT_0008090845 /DNA_START=169 /DNA_END=1278 /DNA_ORIENTATION=-
MATVSTPNERSSLFPPLPPAFRSSGKGNIPKPARKFRSVNNDSSWITNTSSAKQSSLKRMAQAFKDSMRCSPDEAESKTSVEDRTNCIDVQKLLSAMEEMKKCMETFGMQRGPKDLKFHCDRIKLLLKATPPETRASLSGLMSSTSSPADSLVRALSRTRSLSISRTSSLPIPSFSPSPAVAENEEPLPEDSVHDEGVAGDSESDGKEIAAAAKPGAETITSTSKTNKNGCSNNDPLQLPPPQLPQLDRNDRKNGKQSMFWLCYYVRYLYNFHRLVLQGKHDLVDASTMSFMQYLYPYFGEYYDGKDAKSFLKVVADYRTEHFLGPRGSRLGEQSSQELNSFLGILEVVMYLWTPAFKEMALKGELTSQ